MSGIVAIFGGDGAGLGPALRRLDPRGPDARSELRLPGAVFGVAELAPGEPGAAPATDRSGRWTVIADGELLNLRSLTAELAAWGEAPDEATTPAVAAALFAARGFVKGLERLAGDVAFIAWDAETRTAWAARDRSGLRPLHYQAGPTFAVASTPDALGGETDASRALEAVEAGLAFARASTPALAPGQAVSWRAGTLQHERWWAESANPLGADGARYRWARSLQFATELAIQQRAATDAPLAILLSGGVYAEALLAATAARRRDTVLALTFGVDGPGDERTRAAGLAATARARHVTVSVTDAEVREIVAELAARPEPVLGPEAVAWEALARAAWAHDARVVLHGVGGAALFGGAPLPVSERAASLPGLGPLRRLVPATEPVTGLVRMGILEAPLPLPEPPDGSSVGRTLCLQRRVEADGAHQVLDRAAASSGLRLLAPYADGPLVRLVADLPAGHLVQVRRPRGLFLDGLAERLGAQPPEHAPMALPLSAWLPLLDADTVLDGWLPADRLARLRSGTLRQRWALGVLAAWRRAHR